jgi:hypothetical protein
LSIIRSSGALRGTPAAAALCSIAGPTRSVKNLQKSSRPPLVVADEHLSRDHAAAAADGDDD